MKLPRQGGENTQTPTLYHVCRPSPRQTGKIDSSAERHLTEELQATGHTLILHPVCVHQNTSNRGSFLLTLCATSCVLLPIYILVSYHFIMKLPTSLGQGGEIPKRPTLYHVCRPSPWQTGNRQLALLKDTSMKNYRLQATHNPVPNTLFVYMTMIRTPH